MRSYRCLQFMFFVLLLFYGLFSNLVTVSDASRRFFPITVWRMYSAVPRLIEEYDIQIFSPGTNSQTAAKDFLSSTARREKGPMHLSYVAIQNFGEALVAGDEIRIQELRQLVENQYLKGVTDYTVVKLVYDPRARYSNNEVVSRTTIRSFKVGGTQ